MKISIIIPVHKTESVMHITKTLDGIKRTIGIPEREYTITLVGTLPEDVFKKRMNSNWTFLPTTALLGNAKNQGAEYSISQYDPDVLVFMDAHMNFYDNYSANWGKIIYDFLMNRPGTVVAPAISIYDQPLHRGYGVISDITEDNKQMDLKWKWVGTPPANNSPFEVPGLCGCFMAMTPQTFSDSLIGFTPPLAIDDREFSLRIWILGKNMYVIPSLAVGHRFAAGYSDFSKERGIDWGTGMLLYVFLNMDRETMMRLYEKGIWSSPDKRESLRRATTMYWQQVRNRVQSKKVRTAEQYFKRFASL